jgi:hypothetical protein
VPTPKQSYVGKALADTRFAASMTIGESGPDPAAPPVSVDMRRQRLAQVLEVPCEDKTLEELELMCAEVMGVEPIPAAPVATTSTKKGR